MQTDTRLDLVAQLRVDKVSDHVAWKDKVVLQQYQTLSVNPKGTNDMLQREIRQAGLLLPLFVVSPRESNEILPEILQMKDVALEKEC
jgi:hypothetical protein